MPVSRSDLDERRSTSAVVVEAVAEAKGVPPTDVRPPLHHSVDADALNDLFCAKRDASSGNSSISFNYAGYEVTVQSGDEVVVRESRGIEPDVVE
jgi:hypothetical protein